MCKRKILPSVLCVLLISASANAQKDSAFVSVRYTLTHISDTTQPDNPLIENTELLLGKKMSSYANSNKLRPITSLTAVTNGGPMGAPPPPPPPTAEMLVSGNYYKDMASSKMFYMARTNQTLFAVEDKIPVIDWVIKQDTKEIMGLQCQKATGNFKGRTYDAWFCSQLPYSNGPWKLGGLPGLIVEAYDTKKEVIFKMVSFENITGAQPVIEILSSASKTTVKEYKQYQDALEKDRQATAGSYGTITSMTVRGTLTGPDGKPVRLRGSNNPIEKEK